MFTGDSDIEGWPTNSRFPGSANVGVGGWTCKNVLNKIDSQLSTHNPDWVVLVCGENDLAYGTNAATAFSRFSSVFAKIQATGARVLYMGTKPEPDTTPLHNKYQSYDTKIRELAASTAAADASAGAYPKLIMVDVYEGFEAIGNGGNLYQNDDLHLSNQGYALWTAWAIQAMSTQTTSEMQVVLDCYQWRSGTCLAVNNGAGGDINECTDGTHDCDNNAICTDTNGSFSCDCSTGWEGTGTSCANINECTEGTHDCDANAACTDTDGSFSCNCSTGWEGTGTSCTNINECTACARMRGNRYLTGLVRE